MLSAFLGGRVNTDVVIHWIACTILPVDAGTIFVLSGLRRS